ncbi:MAG: DUF5672 family protein [Pedobacter agri]
MKACVVIPLYTDQISEFEKISMQQCFRILERHNIYFVIPKKLESFIKNHDSVLNQQASYQVFDNDFFTDIPAYNKLMKFNGFYQAFLNYDFMLIYQLDAFVFRDELDYWMKQGFDYIGAPLFDGHDDASKSAALVGQGNGGFSLRNIKKCHQIVSKFKRLHFARSFDDIKPGLLITAYRYLKHQIIYNYSGYPFQPLINEDLFWAELIPNTFANFKVPSPQEAMKFSFEVNPDVLFTVNNEKLPFGCHAWWKYDLAFWKPIIEQYGYSLKYPLS